MRSVGRMAHAAPGREMRPTEPVRAGLVAHNLKQVSTFVRHDSLRYRPLPLLATICSMPLVI